jgi:hypothetical protein
VILQRSWLVLALVGLWSVVGCGSEPEPSGPSLDPKVDDKAYIPSADAPSEVWAKRDQRPSGGRNGATIAGTWAQYSVGGAHSCGVREDGIASCWGADGFGQKDVPEGRFVQLAAGGEHSCGLLDDGSIRCWGNPHAGATEAPAGSFTTIEAGWGFNCALRIDGSAACWGFDGAGQASPPAGSFTQLSVGYHHACGLRPDGSAECWGRDDFGQSTVPEGRHTHISAGELHTCVLGERADLRCWGDDHHEAPNVPPGHYSQVSAGYWHTCTITGGGGTACWGHDGVFQASPPREPLISVRSGFYHSCGQRRDKQLECWGWNYNADYLASRVQGGGPVLQGDELFSDRYQPHMCPYESLGLLYLLQDRPDEAKEHLSSALEAQSYWEYSKHLALAEILLEEGDLARAEELLVEALDKYAAQAAQDVAGPEHAADMLARVRALQQDAAQ